jgi:hypothetical protein
MFRNATKVMKRLTLKEGISSNSQTLKHVTM